jgi:hypothetical protein
MKKKETFVMKAPGEIYQDDPVDQAGLDIGFVEAFIDMLSQIDGDRQLDSLKPGTVSAMCSESKKRLERLKRFVETIPTKTVKAA